MATPTEKKDYNQQFLDNFEKVFPKTKVFRMRQYDKDAVAVNGQIPRSTTMIEMNLSSMPKRNSENHRFSIFFTPNGEFKGKDSRQAKDAGKIYTLMVERDDDPEIMVEYRKEFPLQPSIIVRTNRSFHCYWLLKTPLTQDKLKEWQKMNTALWMKFGGDTSIFKDVTQCMRLPGSIHWKNGIQWPVTTCIKFSPKIKYELEDFKPYLEEESQMADILSFKKEYRANKQDSGEDIYDIIQRDVDVREVLADLFPEYKITNTFIDDHGQPTWWYKYYPKGNYVNNFTKEKTERPQWWPFHLAKFFYNSSTRAYKYFYDKYGIGDRLENKITETKVKNITNKEDTLICIESRSSILEFDPKECVITKTTENWPLVICVGYLRVLGYYVREDWLHVYIVRYKKKTGEEWTLEVKKISNLKELTAALAHVGITFHWSKFDVGAIMEHIHWTTNKYIYIQSLWIHSKDLIISNAGKYVLNNKYYVDCQGVVSNDRESNSVMKVGDDITKEQFIDVVKQLKDVYFEPIIYTMFCMYGCAMLSKFIREKIWHLPLLTMVGMSHSGKTSQRHLMMKLFGINNALETHASATEFSIIGLMKHYLPVHMAEFNNWVLRFNFDIFAKNAYDGTGTTRWRADQTVVKYDFNSTLIVDWQTRTIDPAVYSRTMTLFFMENYMKKEFQNPININKYIIDKYDMLEELFVPAYNDWLTLLKTRTANLKISDKTRILENYALAYAFAETYDILDVVKEHLDEQVTIAFAMKGEEDLDRIIKEVFNIWLLSNLVARFEKDFIVVEFYVDTLRYDKRKINDIQSSIQAVNHRFGVDEPAMDNLYIPLDYIFKKKSLHNLFIKFVSKLEAHNHPTYWAAWLAIKEFCDANNYKDAPFYDSLYYRR